ncbi:hypothetical protein DB88DRAFT_270075 [Papiliotrema laurentii]|uniref:Seipin n=1 Tax=Papiliotrema laurentii TaxID=5418 RepID=A0AAD9FQ78_PAPLA|nr:hypothetical protein DB88DRAFT_270075 [Papiliotrema laurentii]
MTSVPTASLDPYLRARSVDPSLIPQAQPARPWRPKRQTDDDFVDFLRKLLRLALSPVTVPLKLIQATLTSPLTVSLVLKLALLGVLTLASAVFSVLAVGAWWYSWGTGGAVEVEGWLMYGSKSHRTPHVLIPLPHERFQEDLRYDVQVEMELVRPLRGQEEMGNFMLSVQLRSAKDPELTVIGASQPSLPPPPRQTSLIPYDLFPVHLLPPCIIPWPFRSLCPSRLLGYGKGPAKRVQNRRARGFVSPASGRDVVLLRKELMEGVIVKPSRGGEVEVGYAFVSVGREDSFAEDSDPASCKSQPREVRTTGWVVVHFVPRPTGIRWLLSAHPLPPLLLLPPLSLTLTLSSSLFAFLVISFVFRNKTPPSKTKKHDHRDRHSTEEALLEEKRRQTFESRDEEERREEERRRREWEEVESSALGGLQRMPEGRKRDSTIGGSETTAPTMITRDFGSSIAESEASESVTETSSQTARDDRSVVESESEGWEEAE